MKALLGGSFVPLPWARKLELTEQALGGCLECLWLNFRSAICYHGARRFFRIACLSELVGYQGSCRPGFPIHGRSSLTVIFLATKKNGPLF